METQAGILSRLEELERHQEQILRRQGEIAEVQHQVLQEQLAKRSDVLVALFGPEMQGTHNVYPLIAVNRGKKSINGFHFTIIVPDVDFLRIHEGKDGKYIRFERFASLGDEQGGSRLTRHYSGYYQHPLYGAQPAVFATLIVDYTMVPADTDMHVDVSWFVVTEDQTIEGSVAEMLKGSEPAPGAAFPEMNGFHVQGSKVKAAAQS
jgi:hypothetical protein